MQTTADDLRAKVRALPKGEKVHYHTGFLFEDRLKDKGLDAFADVLYAMYQAGIIRLVQERKGNVSEYFMVRL